MVRSSYRSYMTDMFSFILSPTDISTVGPPLLWPRRPNRTSRSCIYSTLVRTEIPKQSIAQVRSLARSTYPFARSPISADYFINSWWFPLVREEHARVGHLELLILPYSWARLPPKFGH